MSGMDRVLQDVLARPYALKDVSIDTLRQIWAGVGSTLNATLQNSKVSFFPHNFHLFAPLHDPLCSASSFLQGRLRIHDTSGKRSVPGDPTSIWAGIRAAGIVAGTMVR